MSRIEQLSIEGIRNFAPDVPEIIGFDPPVTLILGKNGSGKTTIIESLKYATTGEMPPGTNRGHSFIHDPKLTPRHISRGQVKLQFSDERNNKYIVSRSMEARLLKSKMEFKGMDGSISIVQADGSLKSHKNKNNDLNAFISNTLGVSKALINNVLFCHQEDSNWPLDEAKKVKDKFDDIFNTTGYVNCQIDIQKKINEQKSNMKDIEKSVEHFKIRKEQAEEYRENIRRQTDRKNELETEIQQLSKERVELEKSLKHANDQYREADEIKIEIRKKQTRLEELERNRLELESDISRIISSTVDELEKDIQKFQSTKGERMNELNNLERELEQNDKDLRSNASVQQEQLVQIGKLRSEEEQHQKRIKMRDDLLKHLATHFQWPDYDILNADGLLSQSQVRQYQALLVETAEQTREEELATKLQLEEKEKKLMSSYNEYREECVRLEQDIKTKDISLSSSKRELAQVEVKLSGMEESSRRMIALEKEQTEAEILLARTEEELCTKNIAEDINRLKSLKAEQEAELDGHRLQLKKVMSQRDTRVKLDMLQKELAMKKQQERRLMSRPDVEEAIQLLVGNEKVDDLLSYYNGRLEATSQNLSRQQQKKSDLEKEAASVGADIRNISHQLETKLTSMNDYKEKLEKAGVGAVGELENDISRLVKELEDLEDQRGLIYGSEKMMVHYIDKLEKHKSNACPLCHREFEQADETQELLGELKSRIERMPTKLADFERKIAERKEKHSTLLQLQPLAQSATKLSDTEIPLLQTELKQRQTRAAAIKVDIQQLEESIEFLKSEDDIFKKVLPDINHLDTIKNDMKKLAAQIESVHTQLGPLTAESSLKVEDVQLQVENVESACKKTQQQIEYFQELNNHQQNKIAELKQNVNRLTALKLQLNHELQQQSSLLERRQALQLSVDQATIDLEDWKLRLQPLVAKQAEAKSAHADAQRNRNTILEHARSKLNELDNQQRQLNGLAEEIDEWFTLGKNSEMERAQQEVDRLENRKTMLESSKKDAQKKVSNLNLALINCENEERNLRNNLKLIVNSAEKDAVVRELQGLGKTLEDYRVPQLIRDIQQLEDQLERCKLKAGEMSGSLQEVIKNLGELEVILSRDEIANAETRYLEQVKDLEINQAVVEDLSSFYNALEWALMKFHKERMSIINNLVREMWHSTYKGKDIDYVEIRAEESAGTGSNSRRQYNYRVVMVKNGVEMDMRGRCSAGQKVLASLIIRMALAEAFSSKCGILALDEPTTNLDEDNIASLSDTILELSNAITRQKRKFQLIVITHDEKFLDRMSRDKRMENYYRVDRNKNNFSEITQWDVVGGIRERDQKKKK